MKKYEAPIRRKVLSGVVILAGVVTVVFGTDALREGLIELAVVDLSVSAFSAGIMVAMRKRPGSMVPNWAFTVIMTSFFVYLFASGGHGGTGLLFMLLIPLATPLFLGWKAGAAVSLVGLAACGGVAVWGSVVSPLQGIPEGALLARLAAIYLVSLIISCLYDSGMQRAYGEESRAKDALQESEERYRSLFSSSLECVYVLDFQGNFLDANEAALKLLGYDRAEITGLNFASLISEDQLPTALAALQEVLEKTTQEHASEYRLRCRDGSFVEVNTTASLVYRERRPYSVQGVARDITERRRAEEALRQSEERYRTILEETGDGYFESDLAGNFTFVNDSQCRLLGYPREELIGRSYRLLFPEDTARGVFEAYNRMYRTGEPVRDFLSEVTRKDGTIGYAETSAFPIRNESGEIVGFRGVRRDITERRQAEQALLESEERYRTLFDRTANPILVIDTGGTYVDSNEAGLAFLECARQELVKKNVRDYSSLGSDEKLLKEHMRLWAGGGRVDIDHHVNGRVKVLDMTITPGTRQGQAVVFGVGTDITERRHAEEAARVQHAYFQQLFDGSPDAILMLDTDDRVNRVNKGFEKLFGYTSEEAIGRPINELVAPEERMSEAACMSEEVLRGRIVRSDAVRRSKDGNPVSVSVVGYPIRFNDEVVGIYVIYTDITRRKEAEDALRRSEERYRTILEEMEDSYFEVDLGGHVTFVNDSACRDLGYSKEEMIGMSYKQFTAEEDVDSVFRIFHEVYRTGALNKGFSWKTTRKDGSHGFAETSVAPLRNDSGEIIGFRGVGRDVTEHRRMQEQLMLTDRLASIGQLTSGIAHELNNPLTGVIGFSDLLLRRDLPAEIKEDLETVNREAKRTSTVVKGLLAFARQQEIEKTPVDINCIIEEVLRLRSYEQRVNNIEVCTQFAPDLPQISGNGAQLQQVFMNIIINAEHAMLGAHARGSLSIVTEWGGGAVRATIADDGPGITAGDMKKLFNPFFTTKEVGKGTGLGLSISHGIVTEHGGRIYAESEPGKGATFVVELPVDTGSNGGHG